MRIQLLYILDCPWCIKTKKLLRQALGELKVKAEIEEIVIDNEEKAKKYKFVGSPTIRINGQDIQEKIDKRQCLPCEELVESRKGVTDFVKQECKCGCRKYYYKGRQYPYPPKGMIKQAIKTANI